MNPPDTNPWNDAFVHLQASQVLHLHAEVARTHRLRQHSKSAWAAWEQAYVHLHQHRNPLDGLWQREVGEAARARSGPWRDAAITYLAVSPRYFRSGYLRDHVCHLLKQSRALNEHEQARIHAALLTGIARRPSVGRFKHDCRLAARWATPTFEAQLQHLAQRKDSWIGGRARRMAFAVSAHQVGLRKRRCGADAWSA